MTYSTDLRTFCSLDWWNFWLTFCFVFLLYWFKSITFTHIKSCWFGFCCCYRCYCCHAVWFDGNNDDDLLRTIMINDGTTSGWRAQSMTVDLHNSSKSFKIVSSSSFFHHAMTFWSLPFYSFFLFCCCCKLIRYVCRSRLVDAIVVVIELWELLPWCKLGDRGKLFPYFGIAIGENFSPKIAIEAKPKKPKRHTWSSLLDGVASRHHGQVVSDHSCLILKVTRIANPSSFLLSLWFLIVCSPGKAALILKHKKDLLKTRRSLQIS